jgi:hypothetical protein
VSSRASCPQPSGADPSGIAIEAQSLEDYAEMATLLETDDERDGSLSSR